MRKSKNSDELTFKTTVRLLGLVVQEWQINGVRCVESGVVWYQIYKTKQSTTTSKYNNSQSSNFPGPTELALGRPCVHLVVVSVRCLSPYKLKDEYNNSCVK